MLIIDFVLSRDHAERETGKDSENILRELGETEKNRKELMGGKSFRERVVSIIVQVSAMKAERRSGPRELGRTSREGFHLTCSLKGE